MTVKNPIFILYNDCCTVLDMVDGKIVKKGVLDRNDLITWLTSLQQAKKTTTLKEFRKIPPNCVFHGYYTDDTGVMVLEIGRAHV